MKDQKDHFEQDSHEPESFERFFSESEAAIRHALVGHFGYEVGREAAAEALAYAWQHWPRVSAYRNPAGYVFRVGQRLARRMSQRRPLPVHEHPGLGGHHHDYEPALEEALQKLSRRQRQAVLLVYGAGWSVRQAAGILSVSPSALQSYLERGLRILRSELGVDG